MKDNIRSYFFIEERLNAARESGDMALEHLCRLCLTAWWRPHDELAYRRAENAIELYRRLNGEMRVPAGRYAP